MLKWRYRFLEEKSSVFPECKISNISNKGEFALAVNHGTYGKLMLINSKGSVVWRKEHDNTIHDPRLSEDGELKLLRRRMV